MKPGRPTKSTPEIRQRILELLREGHYRSSVARACGIDRATLARWMEADSEFCNAVLTAEGEAEFAALRAVMAGAAQDPQHARWYLERKFPQRWGRKDRVEHSGPKGGPIVLVWPDAQRDEGDDGE